MPLKREGEVVYPRHRAYIKAALLPEEKEEPEETPRRGEAGCQMDPEKADASAKEEKRSPAKLMEKEPETRSGEETGGAPGEGDPEEGGWGDARKILVWNLLGRILTRKKSQRLQGSGSTFTKKTPGEGFWYS